MARQSIARRLVFGFGIFFGVVFIVLISIPLLFQGKIKTLIQREVNSKIQADFSFGSVSLSLIRDFPNISLSIEEICLTNREPFAGDTLLDVEQIGIVFDLSSLWNDDGWRLRQITIRSPHLNLKKSVKGAANWEIMPEANGTDRVDTASTQTETAFHLKLNEFVISQACLSYQDDSTGLYALVAGLNHELKGDFTQELFLLQTKTEIDSLSVRNGNMPVLENVRLQLLVDLDANMADTSFTVRQGNLKLNEFGVNLIGFVGLKGEDVITDLKLELPGNDFKNLLSLVPYALSQQFADVKTYGRIELEAYAKGVFNSEQLGEFGIGLKIDTAGFRYPALPKSVDDITVDFKISHDQGGPDLTRVDLQQFHLNIGGNPFDCEFHLQHPVSDPQLDLTMRGEIDILTLRDILPIPPEQELQGRIQTDLEVKGQLSMFQQQQYDQVVARGSFSLIDFKYLSPDFPAPVMIHQFTLNFSPQKVTLQKFYVHLGRTDLNASGMIDNILPFVLKGETLKGAFTFHSQLVDLNEYMDLLMESDTTPLTVIPVPGNLDFELESQVDKILFDRLELTDLAGKIIIREGRADLSRLRMRTLGGELEIADSYYDPTDITAPKIAFNLNLKDMEIPLVSDAIVMVQKFVPIAKHCDGKFSADIKFNSLLDQTLMPLLSSVNGEGSCLTRQVRILGYEPFTKLSDQMKMDQFSQMELKDVNFLFSIADGKLLIQQFPLKMGAIAGTFEGTTTVDQAIDYVMKLEIPSSLLSTDARQSMNHLLGDAGKWASGATMPEKLAISALIVGSVLKPELKISASDLGSAVKEQVKQQLNEKKEEAIQQVKRDLTAEKAKIMAEAETKAQALREEARKLSDQVRDEGYAQADALAKKGGNPLEKAAAKKAAEKLRKETDNKTNKIVSEADQKSEALLNEARQKADRLQ